MEKDPKIFAEKLKEIIFEKVDTLELAKILVKHIRYLEEEVVFEYKKKIFDCRNENKYHIQKISDLKMKKI